MKEQKEFSFPRRKTRRIMVGGVPIGGGAPVVVQSMIKTDSRDIRATTAEIKRLVRVGCEIVRIAVPDQAAAEALAKIKGITSIPLIADIHFDHRLALAAVRAGADGLRINPGNIGSKNKVQEVVRAAQERKIPIRIGVNSGSLEKTLLRKFGGATPEAMVESALGHVRILEDLDFRDIKISLKASDVPRTVTAYRLLARKVDYPFHAGITEAGGLFQGAVKSAAGLSLLLSEGLADTIRVSLTAPPEEEVRVAFQILRSLGLRSGGLNFVSCPVCGRCEVDLMRIASKLERKIGGRPGDLTVAVMGCMVNGPGEAKEADIGVACGKGVGVLFKKGRLLRRVREKEIVSELTKEIEKCLGEHEKH
jgi:(E)-4-hydroxy-3-methylbut-2-enyl-diphosphate synthase